MDRTSAGAEPISNVARFLPESAERQPDFPALRIPVGRVGQNPPGLIKGQGIRYQTLTFAELEAQASAAASVFTARGIERGSRVLLMVKPGRDLILAVFALFKIGAVPVVIDPGMGRKHFLSCVRRTQPTALVGIPLAQWLSRLFRKDFGGLRCRVTVGNRGFSKALERRRGGGFQPAETTANELAAILFTSGSTGPPKGVCYEHGMFEAQVRMIRAQYGIEPGGVDLPMLPIFALFNPALGMTTVVPEMNPSKPATVDPAKIVQAIRQNQVTNSFGSPVLWGKIVDYCEANSLTLPSIQRILMAGAAAPPPLVERMKRLLPNGEVHTPYGATEVLPVASISGAEILEETHSVTQAGGGVCVGQLLPEVSARIIAIRDEPLATMAETTALSAGEIGEIVVTGPSVTKAYDGLASATAKAKISDFGFRISDFEQHGGGERDRGRISEPSENSSASFPNKSAIRDPQSAIVNHRMGDLGYFDGGGRLWFCGRMAERVETPSGLLYTECVEAIFNQHPDVFRTALVGLGERPNQTPCLVVEPTSGCWPEGVGAEKKFAEELRVLGAKHEMTAGIEVIRFRRSFPVDVRHNAKIHRLKLAEEMSGLKV